jgi:hypothetical protein
MLPGFLSLAALRRSPLPGGTRLLGCCILYGELFGLRQHLQQLMAWMPPKNPADSEPRRRLSQRRQFVAQRRFDLDRRPCGRNTRPGEG